MTEQSGGFASAKARLDEIVSQVRKKDTSLEASLDLLEEGVRLANQCTELIDRADWETGSPEADALEAGVPDAAGDGDEDGDAPVGDDGDATPEAVESAPTSGD